MDEEYDVIVLGTGLTVSDVAFEALLKSNSRGRPIWTIGLHRPRYRVTTLRGNSSCIPLDLRNMMKYCYETCYETSTSPSKKSV